MGASPDFCHDGAKALPKTEYILSPKRTGRKLSHVFRTDPAQNFALRASGDLRVNSQ